MLQILLDGKLIEERDYNTWEGEPTVGQRYTHDFDEYEIGSIIVDTRKGVCEVHLVALTPAKSKACA